VGYLSRLVLINSKRQRLLAFCHFDFRHYFLYTINFLKVEIPLRFCISNLILIPCYDLVKEIKGFVRYNWLCRLQVRIHDFGTVYLLNNFILISFDLNCLGMMLDLFRIDDGLS
jgi:hypothetical protein